MHAEGPPRDDNKRDLKEEITMRQIRFTRRDVLKGSSALSATTVFASPVKAAAPEPTAITPALIEAARKEGQVSYYTSIDLPLAEMIAKAFEAKFPRIAVRVERTGAERVFQRIGQEYASSIHAVDVVNSSDASHFIAWKRDGILAPFVPEDVAKFYRAEHKDADGMFASFPHHAQHHRVQYQFCETGRRTEGLRGPARPQMGGQNCQVPSRLQR
jgi:iron(III) transport system substrate-binding protein